MMKLYSTKTTQLNPSANFLFKQILLKYDFIIEDA